VYYPPAGDGWEHRRPEQVGMDSAKLEDAMQFARASETTVFTRDPLEYITRRTTSEGSGEIVGPTKERAPINMVVVRHGYIVAEFGDTRRVDMSFSAAKSFVSTTVGLAFDRGLIKSTNDAVGKYVKDGGYDSIHNSAISWQESFSRQASGKAHCGTSLIPLTEDAGATASCRNTAASGSTTTCVLTA